MVRIAICEDNESCAKKISQKVSQYFWNKETEVKVCIFSKSNEITNINFTDFDLFLLDIELGDISGIELGIKIKKAAPDAAIIYISAFYTYAISGYKARPIAYILKNDVQFDKTLKDSLDDFFWEKLALKEIISLKNKESTRNIFLHEIVFIESFSRKLLIHLLDNENIEVYGKISDMEMQLCNKGFLRVHKSYLINMKFIRKISNYQILLENGKSIPASESRYSEITKTYAVWKGKN